MASNSEIAKIALRLRYHCLRMTTAAGAGHPTSCMSMAEIAAVLFFDEMRMDLRDPMDLGNDEFVLSKGHAAPILYSCFAEAGVIPESELLNLRKITSRLEGHPTTRLPWVKVGTGSLGQGLASACGMAWGIRKVGSPARVYCVMGDGECAEGSVWEAANLGALQKLNNLVAIVDMNGLGQNGVTMHGTDHLAYAFKFQAFGWNCAIIDGHNIAQIKSALARARNSKKPFAIIAKTVKGKGVSFLEGKTDWHGKALKLGELKKALSELGPVPVGRGKKLIKKRPGIFRSKKSKKVTLSLKHLNNPGATRDGFGNALQWLGNSDPKIIAIDGDVRNSTKEDLLFKLKPDQGVNCFIAEQAMTGFGMGLAVKGFNPFVSTFSAFMSRAHDFIRMCGISKLGVKFCGSHSGISIGQDGPSQMGLEDVGIFRAVPGCVVLEPCDVTSAEALTVCLARHKGMGYIRTGRPEVGNVYGGGARFKIGGSNILKSSPRDKVTIVASGIAVHEALKAHEILGKKGISVRVIDAYSIAPLDVAGIIKSVLSTKGRAIAVQDHYIAGGLGEAVATALSGLATVRVLGVNEIPRSGKPEELIKMYGIGAGSIVEEVKRSLR